MQIRYKYSVVLYRDTYVMIINGQVPHKSYPVLLPLSDQTALLLGNPVYVSAGVRLLWPKFSFFSTVHCGTCRDGALNRAKTGCNLRITDSVVK